LPVCAAYYKSKKSHFSDRAIFFYAKKIRQASWLQLFDGRLVVFGNNA